MSPNEVKEVEREIEPDVTIDDFFFFFFVEQKSN